MVAVVFVQLLISIHAPREGGDAAMAVDNDFSEISIHAPREGGDVADQMQDQSSSISIHAPREGGDNRRLPEIFQHTEISIHAPREGGDDSCPRNFSMVKYFNPRPPRGGRPYRQSFLTSLSRFQSTPPARGATI